jgi:hypothetical protein
MILYDLPLIGRSEIRAKGKTKIHIAMKHHSLLAIPVLMLALSGAQSLQAQGTAFTYQGQLKDGAAPANGSYDLTFSLFGVSSGGSAVGGPVIKLAMPVTNGLFTVLLDFGAGQFTSLARWLEIGVRTNGSGGFTTVNPRQSLTPTPYAIYAASAGVGGDSPWLLNGTDTFYNGGNVGIGSSTPSTRLEINATSPGQGVNLSGLAPVFYMSDANKIPRVSWGYAGSTGLYSADALAGDTVLRTETGRLLVQNGGLSSGLALNNNNVGIGTTTPQAKLDVRGDIRLGPSGQFRATSGEENLRIVRGFFNGNGNIIVGSGFAVVRRFEGRYTVTFDTPFSQIPAVTVSGSSTAEGAFPPTLVIHGVSANSFTVEAQGQGGSGGWQDTPAAFIAVGPR